MSAPLDFDWPRWLNEYEREVALYASLQEQVRFTGGPPVSMGRHFLRHNLFDLPRHTRQAAYRKWSAA